MEFDAYYKVAGGLTGIVVVMFLMWKLIGCDDFIDAMFDWDEELL
jgi:hypothetical protein